MQRRKTSSPRMRVTHSRIVSSLPSGGGGCPTKAPMPARILPGHDSSCPARANFSTPFEPKTSSSWPAGPLPPLPFGSGCSLPLWFTHGGSASSAKTNWSAMPSSCEMRTIDGCVANELGPSSQVKPSAWREMTLPPT
eukprot:scaffold22788_cov128-Isochrysis_galbana.AAC.2